jgi:hypothetical protein
MKIYLITSDSRIEIEVEEGSELDLRCPDCSGLRRLWPADLRGIKTGRQ